MKALPIYIFLGMALVLFAFSYHGTNWSDAYKPLSCEHFGDSLLVGFSHNGDLNQAVVTKTNVLQEGYTSPSLWRDIHKISTFYVAFSGDFDREFLIVSADGAGFNVALSRDCYKDFMSFVPDRLKN